MKLRLLTIALGFIVLFSTNITFAQDDSDNPILPIYERKPFYAGPVFGYNRPMHSAKIKTFVDSELNQILCPTFTNGQDNGYYFGLSYEYHIGEEAALATSSIIVRVLYNHLPAVFDEGGDTQPINIIVGGQNEQELNTAVSHRLDVKYDVFTAEAVYKINPFPGMTLGFTAGPTFDFAIGSEMTQTLNLLQPNNAYFAGYPDGHVGDYIDPAGNKYTNNGRTITPANREGDIPDAQQFRFGLKLGVQYEILPRPGVYIVPNFNYNLGITNFNSEFDWRVSPFQFGVDIRFAI